MDLMKIWLPGESPWAEVLAENEDGSRTVRIDNKVAGDYTAREFSERLAALFGDRKPDPRDLRLHTFKCNQIVTVKQITESGVTTWQPVDSPHYH